MKLIIKFGGSIITRKSEEEFPLDYDEIEKQADKYIRKDVIKRLVKELYRAYRKKPFSFILINGAGPFGHHLVHEFLNKKNVRINTIHDSVALLNSRLIEELKKFFRVTPVPPFKTCYYDGKNFDTTKLQRITEKELKGGKVVSTYGDIVPAKRGRLGKFEVISGDDLAVNLSLSLGIKRIIMLTDVDGVFTRDPKLYDDVELIKNLNLTSSEIEFSLTNIDVTGGMASKVRKLSYAARHGTRSRIINGLRKGNLFMVLSGGDIGTKVE